jgi:hypothetical protein
MEKFNVRENYFHCSGCSWIFSFKSNELVVKETKTVIKKAGNVRERVRRFREKKPPTGSINNKRSIQE